MIDITDLKRLAGIQGPCLTIFEPLGDGVEQPVRTCVRLTAAINRGDELLATKILNSPQRARFLTPVQKIASNTDWSGRYGSIVIFRAPGFTKASFWPDAVKPSVHVSDEFFILPLLAGLHARRTFWVLALSIKQVSLFRGSAHDLDEVELPRVIPRNLEAAGDFDRPDHNLENRSCAGPSTVQMGAVRFGTSSLHQTKGKHLRDFFKMIDRGIRPLLEPGGDPLIVAGVSREVTIYREVNTWPHLMRDAIYGSPGALGKARLLAEALKIAMPTLTESLERLRTDLEFAAGRKLLATDLHAIAEAANAGQIEKLFVDPEGRRDEEEINRCVLHVIRNSGTVEAFPFLRVAGGVAAILRYRLPKTEQEQLAATTG